MLLDLNEPKSIVAWWEVFPERHGPLLAHWALRRPEVRGAIALASQMIRANPRTAELLREAELRRAAAEVQAVPLSHDEQLAREDDLDSWEDDHGAGGRADHEASWEVSGEIEGQGAWPEADNWHGRDPINTQARVLDMAY